MAQGCATVTVVLFCLLHVMCDTINIGSVTHLHSWLTTSIHTSRQNTNDDGFFILAAFTSPRTHSPKVRREISSAFVIVHYHCCLVKWQGGLIDVWAPMSLDLEDARNLWQAVVTWHGPNQRFLESDSKKLPVVDVPVGEWLDMGFKPYTCLLITVMYYQATTRLPIRSLVIQFICFFN